MNRVEAVIFDMDGLLLDTERIARSTFIEACRDSNFEPDLEIYYQCIGVTYAQGAEILKSGYGKNFPFWNYRKCLLWENGQSPYRRRCSHKQYSIHQ